MQPIDNEPRFVNVCENTGCFINFICFVNSYWIPGVTIFFLIVCLLYFKLE